MGKEAADALKATRESVGINGNINQNDAAAWVAKGAALHALNRYEEAIQAYDRTLAIDANNAFALWGRKEAAAALKVARQAVVSDGNIDQNDADVWFKKGIALHYFKRYEEELLAYDCALAIDRNYAAAWNRKGVALRALKRYEEAIQAYDAALAIDANNEIAIQGRKAAADALKVGR